MRNIYQQLAVTDSQVLATITSASGSTPQKPGSSAVFGLKGLVSGTIGGGVLEGKVQQLASEAIKSKKSILRHFNLDHDIFHAEDAICGGRASVLIDAAAEDHLHVFKELAISLGKRMPGVLVTTITSLNDDNVSINRYWVTGSKNDKLPPQQKEETEKEVKRLLLQGKDGECSLLELPVPGEKESVLFFFETIFPLPHLIIAGAGHIGKALAKLGRLLDFEVTVIDDRAEFANPDSIPDADHIIVEDVGKALERLDKTKDTYLVIVTRGHKDDEKALRPCIREDVAYIGMIGSRHKVALMRENFLNNSWATKEQWARVYTPIGLEINSKTVWEIAVSIGAQLIFIRNK